MSHFFKKYIKQEYQAQIPQIRYRTNFTNCILEAFQNREYQKVENEGWDIIWSQKEYIPELYDKKLLPHQKINHFKHYQQLCRKDQLIKNLKKHKKNLERDGKTSEANGYNFYPQTFILPNEYVVFADEFKKWQNINDRNVWIMKPTARSQGKGIFLFNRLAQISQWENHSAEPYIVQRYINDPLLIGGKKFDLRLYALVTSYSPLTVYFYRGGFARFTHCRYDDTKIQNSQIHLTNVAIQKHAQGYDENIGGKWYIEGLKQYLLSKFGDNSTNECFIKIQELIIKTLEALQKMMASDKDNSFQLYGFDILLDSKLCPWLIEVNGSPSMTANTLKDKQFKLGLLDDTLTVIDMQKFLEGNEEQIGGFDLICKAKTGKNKDKNPSQNVQKISFLGTLNNRLDNLKKLAKNQSGKLNSLYQQKVNIEKKRILSSATTSGYNSGHPSRRTIVNRKFYAPPQPQRVLTNGNNHNISSNSQVPPKGKDFVIKQKVKREATNENEPFR